MASPKRTSSLRGDPIAAERYRQRGEALRDEHPGSENAKRLAVKLLRQRLKEFESFDWPPGLWDKYDFETALKEAELGHYNAACQQLQTHENPLRELIEAGFVALKGWSSQPAHYRRRVDAIDARKED